MARSENVQFRCEPEIKRQAERIFEELGISLSSGLNMYLRQVVMQNGLPFDAKVRRKVPMNAGHLSEQELSNEIEKGYQDVLKGRTRSADEVFADMEKRYGI